jgi:hypothetical protein
VYWSFTNKFKLEIGVNNSINPNYPNIIWFKQGVFIINSFSKSINADSITISISGQDKMCRLNGTINGSMPHEINLAVEDFVELDGSVTTKRIPIYTIIKEGVM